MLTTWYARPMVKPLLVAIVVFWLLAGCARTQGAAGGWSGVADGGDTVFVGSMEGQLLALDAKDGVRLGSFPEERDKTTFGAIYGTPTIAHDRIYMTGFNGKVYSLSKETLQTTGVAFQVGGEPTNTSITGAVVAAGDKVVFGAAEGAQTGRLYVLDALSLREVCQFPARGTEPIAKLWSTPAVSEGVAYFGDLGHRMYAVSLDDCSLQWPAPVDLGGGIGSTPLVLDGKVYVGAFDRNYYVLDAATGEARALFKAGGWFWSGTATDGKRLFAPNMDGKLYAMDLRAGEVIWEFDTEGAVLSTPVVVNGQVVVGSDTKTLYVLDAERGGKVWEYPLDGQVRAPLMAKENVVYVNTTAHTVDAIDVKAGRAIWRQPFNTKE